MSKKFVVALLLIICANLISVSAQPEKMPAKTTAAVQPYLGCWSGGNTPPSVYQFTKTTIKTSVTRRNAFHYQEVFRDDEKKIFLLELKEKDKQNYLQKFLAIRFTGEEGIELKDYETREAFDRGEESGKLNVFKEDGCKDFQKFFR